MPHIDLLLTKVAKLIDEKGKVKKQEKALKALGQIVGTTGCVVRPYLTHPELLDGIISIIQKTDNTSDELKREATRAFGILGVANPDKLKSMHRRLLEAAQNNGNAVGGVLDSMYSPGGGGEGMEGNNGGSGGDGRAIAAEGQDVVGISEEQTPEETEILRLLKSMGTTGNMLFQDKIPVQSKINFKRGHYYHHHHHRHHRSVHRSSHSLLKRSKSSINNDDYGADSSVPFDRASNWTYNTHKQSSHLAAYHQNEDQVPVNSNKRLKMAGKSNFDIHELLMSPLSLEEYYPAVTINALVNILTNPMLKSHHKQTVNLASKVCTQLFATKSVPLIKELINCCINGISSDGYGSSDSDKVLMEYFNLLRLLINSVQVSEDEKRGRELERSDSKRNMKARAKR